MFAMTRTARRRWTREVSNEVDGIAFSGSGPVLVHGYDPPAGGRWADSAIPGKMAAFDRSSGEDLWVSPCEVGYGRGFGAGISSRNDLIVLGPGSGATSHRIARMALNTGELLDVADTQAFDEAVVGDDVSVCQAPSRVWALDSETLCESWSFSRKGERYRGISRSGERLFVSFTDTKAKRQGVQALDARTGRSLGRILAANQPTIHDVAADAGGTAILATDLETALPPELLTEYLTSTADEDLPDGKALALLAMEHEGREGDAPLWYTKISSDDADDEYPEISISADSGKLYIIKGAFLEVRDMLTGRELGEWTVPGLDERVGWQVCEGAGLLAEETRISIFELPA